MSLEAAFDCLSDQLRLLKDAVSELQLNVSGGYHPESPSRKASDGTSRREESPLPLERLADSVAELEGTVEHARHAASRAGKAVHYPRNLVEAQLGLIVIHRCLNSALKTFLVEVAAYDAVQTLVRMGRQKGGEWPEWVSLLKNVIEACAAPLHKAFQALGGCWEELAEKLSATSASVQATNIGQQITKLKITEAPVNELT